MTSPGWDASELESVLCDFCQKDNAGPLFVRPDQMPVVACATCGLAYLNPRPKPQFVSRLYGRDYFIKATPGTNFGYTDYFTSEHQQALVVEAESRLRMLEQICPVQGARTLEVGCATGEFSDLLRRNGARPLGLDLSDAAVEEGRKKYPQVEFKVGAIEDLEAAAGFDRIFAFELIEHVLSPASFFQRVNSLLKPGGDLVLTTPNLTCGQRVGFANWTGFNSSFEHLYFFSRQSLLNYGKRHGFQEVQWFTGCGDGLPPSRQSPSTKIRIARTLDSLGLLSVALGFKRRIARKEWRPTHLPGGEKHNLLLVLRKQT